METNDRLRDALHAINVASRDQVNRQVSRPAKRPASNLQGEIHQAASKKLSHLLITPSVHGSTIMQNSHPFIRTPAHRPATLLLFSWENENSRRRIMYFRHGTIIISPVVASTRQQTRVPSPNSNIILTGVRFCQPSRPTWMHTYYKPL